MLENQKTHNITSGFVVNSPDNFTIEVDPPESHGGGSLTMTSPGDVQGYTAGVFSRIFTGSIDGFPWKSWNMHQNGEFRCIWMHLSVMLWKLGHLVR